MALDRAVIGTLVMRMLHMFLIQQEGCAYNPNSELYVARAGLDT